MRGHNIDPCETPVIFRLINSLAKLVKYHLCCGVQVSINKILWSMVSKTIQRSVKCN